MLDMIERIRSELVGKYFSNRSELRIMAEGAGLNYVPVEIVAREENHALAVLRPQGLRELVVRAERSLAWQPYYITSVEAR
jgi:hypothetical protein